MKPPIPLNTTLDNDRYRIVKVLGNGAFGRVYLAEHLNGFNELCAIKEFAPDIAYANLPKVKELFDRECRNLQQLDHPQIPRFHELLSTKINGYEYILLVQKFIDGENYHQLLQQRNPLSEVEFVDFLYQILPVLTYLHDRNVIHRDISPDNIICRDPHGTKQPVLIDFGVIKVLSNQYTQVHTIVGKEGYMPDEQRKGHALFPSSDLYALAATGLYLLSKQQPNQFYNAFNAQYNLSKLPISGELRAILDRMLSYQPSDRYQSAAEVLAALSNGLPERLNRKPANNPPVGQGNKITSSIYYMFANADIWGRFKKDFSKPAMYIGGGIAALFIIIIVGHSIFKAVSGLFTPTASTTSTTATTSAGSASPPSSEQRSSLIDRMKAAKVSSADVDRVFFIRHPELKGRVLGNSDADRSLKAEWVQIAEDLIAKSKSNSL
jgi:serine/threonine protein kinase